MGLFNHMFKEGPGVDENVPEKTGAPRFFEIIRRNFFRLIKANWVSFLFALPFFVLILLFVAPFYTKIFALSDIANDAIGSILYNLLFTGLIYNFIGSGPASASYSYIIRSLVNRSYVWVLSDSFKKLKENFKQSILLWITDVAVLYVMSIVIGFYREGTGFINIIAYFFAIAVLLLYGFSHSFIYQIMVSYKCKLSVILKNAFTMMIKKLPVSCGLGISGFILCYLIFGYLGVAGLILYITIGVIFMKMPLEFYAASIIKKQIDV